MAEVTNELMYDGVKQIQTDLHDLKEGQRDYAAALNSMRIPMLGTQTDITNIDATLTRAESRLERIERRLDRVEAP